MGRASGRPYARIRVLVAEDSDLFSEALLAMIEEDPELVVAGVATNGEEAIQMTQTLRPDVVLMDVRMPVLDGLVAVERIMSSTPTPILVMTADPEGRTGSLAFEALRRGALDLVPKPEAWSGTETERAELRSRLKLLARVPVVHHTKRGPRREAPASPSPTRPASTGKRSLVAIGASTGGPPSIARVLSGLPADFALPIVIVQHLSAGFEHQLVHWLSGVTKLRVSVAASGQLLEPRSVYVAPCDRHLLFEHRKALRLEASAPVGGHRPSVDVLFRSIARTFRSDAIGVLLTGMGSDGAEGLLAMHRAGALTLAQSADSCVVDGMPKSARDLGAASAVVALDGIADAIARAARGDELRAGGAR